MEISVRRIISLGVGLLGLIVVGSLLDNWDTLVAKMVPAPVVTEVAYDTMQVAPPEPKRLYGIVVDSMVVIEDKIRRNQNLSDILLNYNVSGEEIHELAKKSKPVFDVRKIGVNKKYTIICNPDSLQTLKCLIYEPNPLEYIVFNLTDTPRVYRETRKIDTLERSMGGYITASLYEDMMDIGASPQLVNELVDVFGWQIDFFKVQKGDQFKVIYEETIVEGEPVGLGKIIGAYFQHFGHDYYAINYDQGNGYDFFDPDGNSLRKAFLRAPIEYTRISSRYSGGRFHPVLKRRIAHLGTDYAAPKGTPIRAVGDGMVIESTYSKYNGNFVKIRHNGTYTTQYLHMSRRAKGMRYGVKVRKGQTIGYVGSTGLANGNHVCYRFWKNGRQVDALKVYIPPSEPIEEANLPYFQSTKYKVMGKLDDVHLPPATSNLLARKQ